MSFEGSTLIGAGTSVTLTETNPSSKVSLVSGTISDKQKDLYKDLNVKFKESSPYPKFAYSIYGRVSEDQTIKGEGDAEIRMTMKRKILLPIYFKGCRYIKEERKFTENEFYCKAKEHRYKNYDIYKLDFTFNEIKFKIFLFHHHFMSITDSTPLPNGKSYRWVHSYNPDSTHPYSYDIYTVKLGFAFNATPLTTNRFFSKVNSLFLSEMKNIRPNNTYCIPPELKVGELTAYRSSESLPTAIVVLKNDVSLKKMNNEDLSSIQLKYILVSITSYLKYRDDFRTGTAVLSEYKGDNLCAGSSG